MNIAWEEKRNAERRAIDEQKVTSAGDSDDVVAVAVAAAAVIAAAFIAAAVIF